MSEKTKDIIEWIECIVIAIVLALLIRYFVGTPTVVQQESMYPNLKPGERLILNRIPRTKKQMPSRGDIITFEAPTKKVVTDKEVDFSKPVAIYSRKFNNVISKFTYYVLEWGKESYIKRVIALPGEHVQIMDGKVYIKGEELDESAYLKDTVVTNSNNGVFTDFTVPEGCVFAMGDNREHSIDCRKFGCIPLEKIEGKVTVRFWPLNKVGKIEKAE